MNLKAYPPEWANHDAQRTAAARWQRRGLLTAAQQAAIDAACPVGYFRPVLFLRIGLFIVTWLGVGSVTGALAALTLVAYGTVFYCLVALAGSVFVLEQVIKGQHHYHSGVDNALLYGAVCAWGVLVFYLLDKLLPYGWHDPLPGSPLLWLALLLVLAAQVLALLRYADPVVAIATFGTALWLLASVLLAFRFGQLLLPFAAIGAAAGLHYWLRTLPARPDYFYYRSCIGVLRALALATIYLAGNYLVVREGNAALLGGRYAYGPAPQIPLAWLFYVCTAGIPLVYIFLGLRRHDRLLLTLGVLALAFSLYTLRRYHAVLPPELAATFGGLLLTALALAALRYLRTPRHGFTAAADDEQASHFNLESLLVAQTAPVPAAPAEAGFQFGGGQSGGGGAVLGWVPHWYTNV